MHDKEVRPIQLLLTNEEWVNLFDLLYSIPSDSDTDNKNINYPESNILRDMRHIIQVALALSCRKDIPVLLTSPSPRVRKFAELLVDHPDFGGE